jgi:hypothetical protein
LFLDGGRVGHEGCSIVNPSASCSKDYRCHPLFCTGRGGLAAKAIKVAKLQPSNYSNP